MTAASVIATRRFTASEVDRMVEVGLLAEDEPLELIEGVLELMSPQSADHVWIKNYLLDLLRDAYGSGRAVYAQDPLAATEDSRPEPDIAVLRGPLASYRGRLPTGADVLLVIEVAVSSLERDHRKAPVYARAGVPVYWIVDVEGRRLEVHTEPSPEGYGVVTLLAERREVQLPELEVRWTVGAMLP